MRSMRYLTMPWLVALFLIVVAEAIGGESAPRAAAAPAATAPAPTAPAATPLTPSEPSREAVWAGHMSAAESAFRTRDYAKAEAELLAAVKMAEGLDEKNDRLAMSLVKQMQTYAAQGKHADAIGPGKRLVAIREKAYGADHLAVAAALNDLAGQYKDLEKFDEAVPLYTRGLAIAEKAGGARLVGMVLNNLAQIYLDQDKLDEAEKSATRALRIRGQTDGTRHDAYADSLRTLATIYTARGKHAEAEALLRQVLAIRRKTQIWNRPVMIRAMTDIADACKAQENFESAETLYKAALKTGEDGLGTNDDVRAEVYEAYADLLKQLKRDEEANQMAEQARIIRSRLAGPGGAPSGPSK